MNLSTQNATELKDQLFCATESGDLDTVKRLLELFPRLAQETINDMNFLKFAARHGHRHILKQFLLDCDSLLIIDLIKAASVDGHYETIQYLMLRLSRFFDYQDLSSQVYDELKSIVPQRLHFTLEFPLMWSKIKSALYLYKKGKLPELPIKKLVKFLY